MSTVPTECCKDVWVLMKVGETRAEVRIAGDQLGRRAQEVDVSDLFLYEDDFEKRMMRRVLVPIVSRAACEAAHQATWVEVSRMLGLDPEKGR